MSSPAAVAAPAIDLAIAGLRWRLLPDDEAWRGALEVRYGAFVVPSGGTPDVEVVLGATSRPTDVAALWRQLETETFRGGCDTAGRLVAASPSTRVEVDPVARRIAASGPLNRHVLDIALRTALPFLVPESLLLHGALLCEGGRGWLAAGPSGCGKTTLAGLFPERRGCDELTLLQRLAGGWQAHALPFWNGRRASCRLVGIHLLRHAPADLRRRLAPGEALRRLGQEVAWPDASSATLSAAWDRLTDLLVAVPVYELGFRPTGAVWEVLAVEEAA